MFEYTLGNAIWITDQKSGSELLPIESLQALMYQIVERLHNANSSRGLLKHITLHLYLLSGQKPMRLVTVSADVVKRYKEIQSLLIEPKPRDIEGDKKV